MYCEINAVTRYWRMPAENSGVSSGSTDVPAAAVEGETSEHGAVSPSSRAGEKPLVGGITMCCMINRIRLIRIYEMPSGSCGARTARSCFTAHGGSLFKISKQKQIVYSSFVIRSYFWLAMPRGDFSIFTFSTLVRN